MTTIPVGVSGPRRATHEAEDASLKRLRWSVRAVLTLGVAASIAANVLHARPNLISQLIAAWPPMALLLTVELLSRVPTDRRGLSAVRLSAAAIIAVIAGWVSYWHMAGVAARYGETSAAASYLLPISVDGLVLVASVSLVEIAGRINTCTTATASTPPPAATSTAQQNESVPAYRGGHAELHPDPPDPLGEPIGRRLNGRRPRPGATTAAADCGRPPDLTFPTSAVPSRRPARHGAAARTIAATPPERMPFPVFEDDQSGTGPVHSDAIPAMTDPAAHAGQTRTTASPQNTSPDVAPAQRPLEEIVAAGTRRAAAGGGETTKDPHEEGNAAVIDDSFVPSQTAAAVAYWHRRDPSLHPAEIAERIRRSERTVRRHWPRHP